MHPRFLVFIILLALSPASASAADCYRECMDVASCGSSMDSSYCSGVQARCSTDCRHASEGGAKVYGAIAYSAKDEAYGYSDGWSNQKKAEKVALKYCQEKGQKCEPLVWFYNGCGAVAADGKKVGWGQNSSLQAATQQALDNCAKSGGKNCTLKASHCSG